MVSGRERLAASVTPLGVTQAPPLLSPHLSLRTFIGRPAHRPFRRHRRHSSPPLFLSQPQYPPPLPPRYTTTTPHPRPALFPLSCAPRRPLLPPPPSLPPPCSSYSSSSRRSHSRPAVERKERSPRGRRSEGRERRQ
ncbi:hypothetical protein E2C01_065018 [Portunus trituberculatus]|uniref:Uncharacterized protein n=1 Tax=Portunus trituberculatus TaxID=210409 RepID=A0A5B7HEK3_PORTR|nr:hypothetical protein [Portunus trituberculatus]